jgi:hypothetical protein
VNQDALSAKAIALVEEAFEGKGGYKGALSEGQLALKGGMRQVFDMMTEYRKKRKKREYILLVFKVSIDSRDAKAQVRLMEAFMERVGHTLPTELHDLPADQLALHWEEILLSYAESIDKISELLKRL